MLELLHRHKIHEPIALSALVAAGFSLNTVWILNLLADRTHIVFNNLTIDNRVGPVTGLYLMGALIYAFVFGSATLWFRGKDCRLFRDRALWFLVASVIAYLVMTIPEVYSFEITPPSV